MAAPPSYQDAISVPTRTAPSEVPKEIQVYTVALDPSQAAPFPEPANVWVSGDLTKEDWVNFTSNIAVVLKSKEKQKQTESAEEQEGRLYELLNAWNAGFFEPRGLKVVPSSVTGSCGDSASRFHFGGGKFGVSVGGALLGVDMSKSTAGK